MTSSLSALTIYNKRTIYHDPLFELTKMISINSGVNIGVQRSLSFKPATLTSVVLKFPRPQLLELVILDFLTRPSAYGPKEKKRLSKAMTNCPPSETFPDWTKFTSALMKVAFTDLEEMT